MSLKNDVLYMLINSNYAVSGETIAKRLSVSRNAVWKAVNSLKDNGYNIDAVQNKGYLLCEDSNILNEFIIKKYLEEDNKNCKIEILDRIDSTNSYVKSIAEKGENEKFVAIADSQSAGRGRRGKGFVSPVGRGLYMSFLFKPELSASETALLTVASCTAVAEAIDKLYGCESSIKWVNDIFVKRKKVCGILTEASMDFESGGISYAVVGIGINVTGKDFPDEIKNIASSLEESCGKIISRNRLAAEVINNVYKYYSSLSDRKYIKKYREKSFVIGKTITVLDPAAPYEAEATGIDENGCLINKFDGKEKILNSGEISIKI